jgi:hypothetical protein
MSNYELKFCLILKGALKDAPNLLVTPRTAFYSETSCREMREMAAQEVRRGLLNKLPGSLRNCVNKELILLHQKQHHHHHHPQANTNSQHTSNGSGSAVSHSRHLNQQTSSRQNNGASSPSNSSLQAPVNQLANVASPLLSSPSANHNAQLLAQLSCK